MFKIQKIKFKNFRFFYGEVELPVDSKNLLIYGENGSGKSSIYWGLHLFLQSVLKEKPEEVQRYFLPFIRSEESLKNRYAEDRDESYIEITFIDEHGDPRIKKVSNTIVSTRSDDFIPTVQAVSDLIDYKTIFNIYNFKNSQELELFGYFEKELFDYINLRTQLVTVEGDELKTTAKSWWDYLKKGLTPYPGIYAQSYHDFRELVTTFNNDLSFYLDSIAIQANKYLKDHLKEPIEIRFDFEKVIYNGFNEHNKGRNKITLPPKILLRSRLLHKGLEELRGAVDRPHSFLNEAKLSAIAIAIRLAILDQKFEEAPPKLLVLDDLLLSLDMGNRETVITLILEEFSKKYQTIFLTHDRQFFYALRSHLKVYHGNILKRTGENNKELIDNEYQNHWKTIEMFEAEDTEGRKVPFITEHKSNIQKANFYFKTQIDYQAAGNNLRSALEEFFKSFLPKTLLRDGDGQPIPENNLTLSFLIDTCINYFNSLNWNTDMLDKLNRYRERALNQSSHFNPTANFYKKELQETFAIYEKLQHYRNDIIVPTNNHVCFSVLDDQGNIYSYTAILLDDIRLYLSPEVGASSFYSANDKRVFIVIGFTTNGQTVLEKIKTGLRSLSEFYEEAISGLERKKVVNCIREPDMEEVFRTIDNRSLKSLKGY